MRLIDGARDVIRAKGYAATTIDDLCAAAGISKGGFFHHFVSKEQLGLAAIQRFNDMASHLFRAAPFASDADPRSRLLGYIDFRISILSCDVVQYTCLLGTMVQEVHATHPFLRDACAAGMAAHVAALTHDIEEAKQRHAPDADWSAESVGYFTQSVLQGAFIFAKARQDASVVAESLTHLRRYLVSLFGEPRKDRTA